MNKIIWTVATGIVIGGIVGVGVYVSHAGRTLPAQAAVVLDLSDSRFKDCNAVSAMAHELVSSLQMGKGSKLYLFGTGGEDTADEPQLLGSFSVYRSNRVLEDKKKSERLETQMYENLSSRCGGAPQRTRSPIFLAIKRVIEHLRARGCDGKTPCAVYVQTDGEELSEVAIKNVLTEPNTSIRGAKRLPTQIDNSGIQVRICGFAQVSRMPKKRGGIRSASRIDQQRETWQQLFVEPQSVMIEPHCPQQ